MTFYISLNYIKNTQFITLYYHSVKIRIEYWQ